MSAAPAPRQDGHPYGAIQLGEEAGLSLRINEPELPWPPFPEQADRFLVKLVGLAPGVGR